MKFSRKRFLGAAAGTAASAAEQQLGILEGPSAALYYETHGNGPLMLMIPGAAGSADSFRWVSFFLLSERELRQYPVVDLDLDALRAYAGRIVRWRVWNRVGIRPTR